jgi:hypothetical protein
MWVISATFFLLQVAITCFPTTQVLLGSVLSRRADTTAMIGTALLASARGDGYRRIAADIRCPPVRRWLRSVRGGHTEPSSAGEFQDG